MDINLWYNEKQTSKERTDFMTMESIKLKLQNIIDVTKKKYREFKLWARIKWRKAVFTVETKMGLPVRCEYCRENIFCEQYRGLRMDLRMKGENISWTKRISYAWRALKNNLFNVERCWDHYSDK